ncbi:MAG: hypothetical protein HQL75_00225 [Magnetococcales bacterium]|nr:hypothetical protein [Magnetococcales bacterium]
MTIAHEVMVLPSEYGVPILYGDTIGFPQFSFGVNVTIKVGFFADISSDENAPTVAADSYQFWSDS